MCPRTARAVVPFSISQPGEDAVPPDTTERRHSLPLQACPDWLTLKATPARPGCGIHPSGSTYFHPRLHLPVAAEERKAAVAEGAVVAAAADADYQDDEQSQSDEEPEPETVHGG